VAEAAAGQIDAQEELGAGHDVQGVEQAQCSHVARCGRAPALAPESKTARSPAPFFIAPSRPKPP
jgi:hypothetical protein